MAAPEFSSQDGFERDFAAVVLQAWRGEMTFAQLIDAVSLVDTGPGSETSRPLAIVLYQTWLSRNPSPYAYAAYFNLGVALGTEGDYAAAKAAYLRSIELWPSFAQPRLNLGTLYERQGLIDDALAEWRWVEQNLSAQKPEDKPLLLMALNNLGRVLETKVRLDEALGLLTRSLAIEPAQPAVLHHWIHLRQKQCIWPVCEPLPGIDVDAMYQAASAVAMLNLTDDPKAQRAAADRYVQSRVNANVPRLANPKGYGHQRLRIAYVSGDFCLHPVSLLMAELFELHDRTQFEVYGYCWSPQDGSAMRERVVKAMDTFTRIDQMSDEAAARLMREHEIDVLIDLQGQTAGARANLLAWRPASIQITYLGLPATTGLPSIDYVIADTFLIPETSASFYSEKPLYMPDVYQVSDRQRAIGVASSRAACGLPETGFVFCSLNNSYKFTPEMFEVWMRILKRTPASVLWLLSDNRWAEANLRAAAQASGITADRLVFSPRVSPDNYLARCAVADLFLDTFPFNAGTTANDALWMGLPVLTCSGQTFASRMAGALLTAAGLSELITYNFKDYEDKAVELASRLQGTAQLKAHLKQVHQTGVLFDTPLFVRNLEVRLKRLCTAL